MAVNKRRIATQQVSCSCSMPGVWKAVSHNEGAVVVYHAPHACAHITEEMDRNRHFRTMVRHEFRREAYTAPLITSGIGRDESIFGGTEMLASCLAYVVRTYQPKYLVVTNSCVSGVIGDDTKTICEETEQELGIPVLYVDCHGFLDGEYYGGYVLAAKGLIDRFMKRQEKVPKQVVILGEKDGPTSLAFQDFKELLADFGFTIYNRFPGYSSMEEMDIIARSSFSFILGGTQKSYLELRKIADYMEEQLGIIHFAADYPIGWEKTKAWIEALGTFLQEKEQVKPTLDRLWNTFETGVRKYKDTFLQTPTILYIGQKSDYFRLDWVLEWIVLGGLDIRRVIFMDILSEEERQRYREEIEEVFPHMCFEIESSQTECNAEEVVITTHELMDASLRQLLLPMLPPIGTAGYLQMYKKFYSLARTLAGRGVVLYGW